MTDQLHDLVPAEALAAYRALAMAIMDLEESQPPIHAPKRITDLAERCIDLDPPRAPDVYPKVTPFGHLMGAPGRPLSHTARKQLAARDGGKIWIVIGWTAVWVLVLIFLAAHRQGF